MNMCSGRLAARMATALAMMALLAVTDLGWGRGVPAKQAPVVVMGASGKSSCSNTPSSTQFSGEATVISLTNSTQPPLIVIGDTGQLPSTGGNIDVSVTQTNMEGLSVDLG